MLFVFKNHSKKMSFSFIEISLFLIFFYSSFTFTNGINTDVILRVDGNGFHRTLNYIVNFQNFEKDNCHVALYFEFTSSLHVNIDEISDLLRKGEITSCSEGEVDVELFAEKAGGQNVTICSSLIGSEVNLALPIHQRYHAAREGGGYVELKIPKPQLLIGCEDRIKENRVSKIKLCSPCFELAEKWRDMPYSLNPEGEDYIWYVPVGDTTMLLVITWVTNIVVSCGTLYTLWIIYKVNVSGVKDLKKS